MSLVSYNCVILPYPFHTDFRQEAIYDDLSQTDRILTKFDIKLQAVLNANYLNLMAPDLIGETQNPADIMQVVRERLLKPRQQLSIKMNGQELIPQPIVGNTGTVDAKNGPQPQMCQLTSLTNTTFLLTYHIIAHYWAFISPGAAIPPVYNQPGHPVLYNRWTETVNIDERNMTQRTREGKFVIRSDNIDGLIADQLRDQMAVVGLPKGFLRQSSQYIQDPNGLAIRYRVVDQEVYRMPPKPAFKASGRYVERTDWPFILHVGEATLRLEGSKDTKQSELLDAAVSIIAQKLRLPGLNGLVPDNANNGYLGGNAVSVDMYENVVEVRAKTYLKPSTGKTGKERRHTFWGLDYKNLTNPPFDNGAGPDYQPAYSSRGSAGILLQAAAYYDPNLRNTLVNQKTGQLSAGTRVGLAGLHNEGKSDCPVSGGDAQPNSISEEDQDITTQNTASIATAPISAGEDIGGQDETALYSTDKLSNDTISVWSDYHIINNTESDKHIYMMPISSPLGFTDSSNGDKQTVAFVQLAAPTTLMISQVSGTRMNAKPTLPDPKKLADSNWVLLDEHYLTFPITLAGDGVTPIYRIGAVFVYGHLNPDADAFKNVTFGKPPWMDDQNTIERTLKTTDFDENIIDTSQSNTLTTTPGQSLPPGLTGP